VQAPAEGTTEAEEAWAEYYEQYPEAREQGITQPEGVVEAPEAVAEPFQEDGATEAAEGGAEPGGEATEDAGGSEDPS
jgi:hypothetical protein